MSCRLHNDRRKPLSSLRHWYRPIRVRIPATNRAVAAKIRMMGKKTGTMEMSSTGSVCYTVFRPAVAFGEVMPHSSFSCRFGMVPPY